VCTPLPPLLNLSRISCLPRSQPRGYALACRHHEASGAEIVPGRHSARTRRRRHRARGRIFFLTCPRKSLWPCWCEMVSYPQNLQMVTLRMCRFFLCVCQFLKKPREGHRYSHQTYRESWLTHTHTFSHMHYIISPHTLSQPRVYTLSHTQSKSACTHTHTQRLIRTHRPSLHTPTHTQGTSTKTITVQVHIDNVCLETYMIEAVRDI